MWETPWVSTYQELKFVGHTSHLTDWRMVSQPLWTSWLEHFLPVPNRQQHLLTHIDALMPSSLSGWVHIYSCTQYRNWPPWRNSLSYKDIDSLHQHRVVVLDEMHGNTGILAHTEKVAFPCWLRWGVVNAKLYHWRNWFPFLGSQSLIKYIRASSQPPYFSPLFVHLPVGGIH